jgi:hypothetical protein
MTKAQRLARLTSLAKDGGRAGADAAKNVDRIAAVSLRKPLISGISHFSSASFLHASRR